MYIPNLCQLNIKDIPVIKQNSSMPSRKNMLVLQLLIYMNFVT